MGGSASLFLVPVVLFVVQTPLRNCDEGSQLPASQVASKQEVNSFGRRAVKANEAIYRPSCERVDVKRGGEDFVSRRSRTFPSPSASVDLAHLRLVR